MCDPGTILATASLAIGVGKTIASYEGAKRREGAIDQAADTAARQETSQLTQREGQEQDAAAQSVMQADRQARFTDAEARVQAGESGVAGASVDALLHDIQNKESAFKVATNTNLTNTLSQIEMEKQGIRVNAQNQKTQAAANTPTGLDLGLGLAGNALDFGSVLIRRTPKAGG